jgi:hypothetical protein
MIKILLDTNAIHGHWLLEAEAFTLLSELASRQKCEVFLSEVTILEHLRHYEEWAHSTEQNLKSTLFGNAGLFVTKPPEKALPALCDRSEFEKRFRARLKELGFAVISFPSVSHEEIVKRDLNVKKPFDSKGKGYRDTLLWLGFVGVIDKDTTKAVLVSENVKDFCGDDKSKVHKDLRADLDQIHPKVEDQVFLGTRKLTDELVRPILDKLAQADAIEKKEQQKAQRILKQIQDDKYKYFQLDDVVSEGMEYFESQEAEGVFYAGDVPLEEPLYATMIEDPANAEATKIYKLKSGNYLCEGTADVYATIEGYLDKGSAISAFEDGDAFISTPHHNEWYSEVEVSNRRARITFSFEFEEKSSEILRFEVTKVESNA